MVQRKFSLWKKILPKISRSAVLNLKAEIHGKVFIDDEAIIGKSKIIAGSNCIVNIGRKTTIRDCVLITTTDNKLDIKESELYEVKDVFIGNKVFISSEVNIYGPTLISDGTYIGCNTTICNSKIGQNCVIEDRVLIKDTDLPPNTVVPSKSVVDSHEKLKELILSNRYESYYNYLGTSLFNKAG